MHLIEDLVADSIWVIDADAADGDPGVRDRIAALYRFQSGYDCSFTRFRLMDVLLKRGFAYRFELSDHPELVGVLTGLTEFTAVSELEERCEGAEERWPDDAWLDAGYVDPPYLYCETGTALWRRMVAAGRITGPGAVPPVRVLLLDVVLEVARAAERRDDRALIGLWYGFGPDALLDGHPALPFDAFDLDALPAARELREIVRRTAALEADLPEGFLAPSGLFTDERETWWWDV